MGRRNNYQKKKEDEKRGLQKRIESTRGVKVQKLEKREAVLGKKSSESNACLVVLVHSLDRLDCDFILYGTRMLMVVVKLFNDQRRKESSSSARSTLCSRRKEKIWEDPPTALFFVGW